MSLKRSPDGHVPWRLAPERTRQWDGWTAKWPWSAAAPGASAQPSPSDSSTDIKAAAPALARAGTASIINVSSIAGLRGYENLSGYTASKFGVRGRTKSAALDLGGSGIRVNSVHPASLRHP